MCYCVCWFGLTAVLACRLSPCLCQNVFVLCSSCVDPLSVSVLPGICQLFSAEAHLPYECVSLLHNLVLVQCARKRVGMFLHGLSSCVCVCLQSCAAGGCFKQQTASAAWSTVWSNIVNPSLGGRNLASGRPLRFSLETQTQLAAMCCLTTASLHLA